MNPALWSLIGSVLVLIGASRQAWFELRDWYNELESTLTLALELVREDQRVELAEELEHLTGPRRVAKKRELNRLARKELERRGLDLLSPAERELIEISTRSTISWSFIVLGSAALVVGAALALFR